MFNLWSFLRKVEGLMPSSAQICFLVLKEMLFFMIKEVERSIRPKIVKAFF